MNTSYFFSPKLNNDQKLVSIARKPPGNLVTKFPKILVYKPLCPSWNLVMSYKSGKITKEQYTDHYYSEILDNLDPAKTYQELGEDSILLCWERSDKFCHRHIVSKWLMDNLNINIKEL
jgi:hypothetical protein